MHDANPALPARTLRPGQSRFVNAAEGFRLEVSGGCLWLTRPDDPVDHFLVAGASLELHENHVLIQSDWRYGSSNVTYQRPAHYVLVPLPVPSADTHSPSTSFWKSLLERLGAGRMQQV
jgi:hypothetical protein